MKRKNESGALVVEAAIVVTVVTMFIAVMLYIGMVLYQQSLVNVMANQTASNIAQIYGNTLRDPFTGYVDANGVHETVTYANLRNQAYMDVIKQKADAAALYRLKSSRILTTGTTEVEVEIVPKKNELLKDQIVVKVSDKYEIPLISFFGAGNNNLEFTGTGRADCTDLLEYLTGVPAMGTSEGNAVIFSKEECTVNFYKHLGDSRPLKTVTVLRGNTVNGSTDYSHSTMPDKPTQDKMRFTKWIKADGRTFNGDSTVNEDIDVYGNWECTVTFDPDGGKIVPTLNPPSMTATVTGNINLPVAERKNCTFAGWYTKKNGEGEEFTGIDVKGDITVYAKWLCTVSFDTNSTDVFEPINVLYGSKLESVPTPSRTNCNFDNWWYSTSYKKDDKFNLNDAIKKHTTLYAKWITDVTVDATGGTITVDNNKVGKKDFAAVVGKTLKVPSPNEPYKCWGFKKWNYKTDGTGIDFKSSKTIVNDKTTIYAIWEYNHKKVEKSRSGSVCGGGTIYYWCEYCHIDMGTDSYSGIGGHSYSYTCGVKHGLGTFNGIGGGCERYHKAGQYDQDANGASLSDYCDQAYGYCRVCKYCYNTDPEYLWCGQPHSGNDYKYACTPVNGHRY